MVAYADILTMSNNARLGNFRDLGRLLRILIRGENYQSGSGAPTVTPKAIGEHYFDSTNNVWYRANGISASTDWMVTARSIASRLLAAGATKTLTAADDGKTVLLDTAAGSVVTLPAASGSGNHFRFQVKTTATSNSHKIQVANGTDIIQGVILELSDDAGAVAKGWEAGASDDTITLNRGTTGTAKVGHFIEIEDIASGVFAVHGTMAASGTEATPFSSAV